MGRRPHLDCQRLDPEPASRGSPLAPTGASHPHKEQVERRGLRHGLHKTLPADETGLRGGSPPNQRKEAEMPSVSHTGLQTGSSSQALAPTGPSKSLSSYSALPGVCHAEGHLHI